MQHAVNLLKLIALDDDDLQVVSAHLQDATIKVADVHWRPAENRVIIVLNRFDWEGAHGNGEYRRCRTALRFERVLSCKCRGVDCADKDGILNLLAITFESGEAPGGAVVLDFSGGGALRLDVECVEAEVADLGPAWAAAACPDHRDIAEAHPAAATPARH